MDNIDTVADPTDWGMTAVSSLQPVESALRCQVCKEFFNTPVITSCAHTFCSLCIRRCLTHDGRCPTCRTEDQPLRLRRNWIVEELVNSFQAARPQILQLGREVEAVRADRGPRSLKRKLQDISVMDTPSEPLSSRRRTRSQSKRILDPATSTPSEPESQPELSDSGEDMSVFEAPPLDDGKVECPICQARMKEEEVSPHIDRTHLGPLPVNGNPQQSTLGLRDGRSPSESCTPARQPERLSPLNYSLLSDNALRKKLGSLGIPTAGNKQLMTRRHREWVDLWNANCDSTNPRPKKDLLRDLDRWERTQGGLARSTEESSGIMSKDFDGSAWAQNNDSDFKRLIAQAKSKRFVTLPPQVQDIRECSSKEPMPTAGAGPGAGS